MPRRPLFPFFILTLLAAGLVPRAVLATDLPVDRPLPAGSMPMVIRDATAPVPNAPTAPTAPRERAPSVEEPR